LQTTSNPSPFGYSPLIKGRVGDVQNFNADFVIKFSSVKEFLYLCGKIFEYGRKI